MFGGDHEWGRFWERSGLYSMLKLHPPRSQATTMKNFVVNQFNTFGSGFLLVKVWK